MEKKTEDQEQQDKRRLKHLGFSNDRPEFQELPSFGNNDAIALTHWQEYGSDEN